MKSNEVFGFYVEKEYVGKRVKGSKVRVVWKFACMPDLKTTEVELKHSLMFGKREIKLNGQVVFHKKKMFSGDFSHSTLSEGRVVSITIKDDFEGYVYDCLVDGVPFHRLARLSIEELEAKRKTIKSDGNAVTTMNYDDFLKPRSSSTTSRDSLSNIERRSSIDKKPSKELGNSRRYSTGSQMSQHSYEAATPGWPQKDCAPGWGGNEDSTTPAVASTNATSRSATHSYDYTSTPSTKQRSRGGSVPAYMTNPNQYQSSSSRRLSTDSYSSFGGSGQINTTTSNQYGSGDPFAVPPPALPSLQRAHSTGESPSYINNSNNYSTYSSSGYGGSTNPFLVSSTPMTSSSPLTTSYSSHPYTSNTSQSQQYTSATTSTNPYGNVANNNTGGYVAGSSNYGGRINTAYSATSSTNTYHHPYSSASTGSSSNPLIWDS